MSGSLVSPRAPTGAEDRQRRGLAYGGGWVYGWCVSGRGVDFFVSHTGRDTAWAEWLAWQLEQAGYSVELDVWDWAPGEDFEARMSAALERADRLLAVCNRDLLRLRVRGRRTARGVRAVRGGAGADRAGAGRAGDPAFAVRHAHPSQPDGFTRGHRSSPATGPADRW